VAELRGLTEWPLKSRDLTLTYVRVHTHTHTHTYARMHVCMYKLIHACIFMKTTLQKKDFNCVKMLKVDFLTKL